MNLFWILISSVRFLSWSFRSANARFTGGRLRRPPAPPRIIHEGTPFPVTVSRILRSLPLRLSPLPDDAWDPAAAHEKDSRPPTTYDKEKGFSFSHSYRSSHSLRLSSLVAHPLSCEGTDLSLHSFRSLPHPTGDRKVRSWLGGSRS